MAEGAADIYPRLSAISEWDIAAGHAILEAAGGLVADSRGQPLRFGQRKGDFAVPEFIAWGDASKDVVKDYCASSDFSFGQRRWADCAKPSGLAANAVRLVSLENR